MTMGVGPGPSRSDIVSAWLRSDFTHLIFTDGPRGDTCLSTFAAQLYTGHRPERYAICTYNRERGGLDFTMMVEGDAGSGYGPLKS